MHGHSYFDEFEDFDVATCKYGTHGILKYDKSVGFMFRNQA